MEVVIARLGEPYRAQHPFFGLHHIADFALLDRKLVIEVDGASHDRPEQIRKDLQHTIGLVKLGWRVVRVKNEAVFADPQGALDDCLHRATSLPSREELEALAVELGPVPLAARPKRRRPRRAPARG